MGNDFFLSRKEVVLSVLLQLALSVFLGHGYDLRVGFVAGRNVMSAQSPYEGGSLPPDMSVGYRETVQGLGETPLWALYLGLSYVLSLGNLNLFNIIMKLPIFSANLGLAYFFFSRRNFSWKFFLFNPFLLATSTAWGKPDNLATLLALLALLVRDKPLRAGLLVSISLMVKPLALPMATVLVGYYAFQGVGKIARYVGCVFILSAVTFYAPFVILGWPIETVTFGLFNWLKPAGGLSLFNISEYFQGEQSLPPLLLWAGWLSPATLVLSLLYSLVRPPTNPREAATYSLSASCFFLATRTWVSEQNLVLILALFMIVAGRLPSRGLWIIPLMFSLSNNGLQQLLYPSYPSIVLELRDLDTLTSNFRLVIRFIIVIPWLYVLFKNLSRMTDISKHAWLLKRR